MKILLWPFLVAALISFIATPVVRKGATRFGFMDIPKDERRVHKKAIPLSGGLAIFLAVLAGVLLFLPLEREKIAYLAGGAVIVITGLYDDKFAMSAKAKFAMEIVAAVILIAGGIKITFFTNPFYGNNLLINLDWLAVPITIFLGGGHYHHH